MPGDVAARILPVTERRSLSPHSFTHRANSVPCGSPAVTGSTMGLPSSTRISGWVGPVLYTGGIVSMRSHTTKPLPAAHLLVQACQHIWLALCDDALPDVHICWSYPSISSVCPPLCWQVRLNLTAQLTENRRLHCPRSFTPNRCQFRMSG